MGQTTTHGRPGRGPGLVRRMLMGKGRGKHSPFRWDPAPSPDVIDLGTPSEAISLARIERLETGTRLLAETMKLTYGRMTAAIEDLRRQSARAASVEEVQRLVAVTLRRLNGNGRRPGSSSARIGHALPLDLGGTEEPLDALTALRRSRFAGGEAEGS